MLAPLASSSGMPDWARLSGDLKPGFSRFSRSSAVIACLAAAACLARSAANALWMRPGAGARFSAAACEFEEEEDEAAGSDDIVCKNMNSHLTTFTFTHRQ